MKVLILCLVLSACSFFNNKVDNISNKEIISKKNEPQVIEKTYDDLVSSISFNKSIIKQDKLFVCNKVGDIYQLYCGEDKKAFDGEVSLKYGNLNYLWNISDGKISSLKFFEGENLIFDYSKIISNNVTDIKGGEQKTFYPDGKIKTLIKMVGLDFEVYNYCPQGQIFKNDSVRFSHNSNSYNGIYVVNFLTDVYRDNNLISKVANKFVKNGNQISFFIGDIQNSSLNGNFKIVACDGKNVIEEVRLNNGNVVK